MNLKLIKSRQIVVTILLILLIGLVDSKIYSDAKNTFRSNSKLEIKNKVSNFKSRKTLLRSESYD